MGAPMSSFLEATGSIVEQAWAWFVVVGTLVLLAVAWRVLGTLAERHKAVDPRARTKRLMALGAAVLLGAGGWFAISSFEASADAGIHKTFVSSLNLTVGEGDYLDAVKVTETKPAALATQQASLDAANAKLSSEPNAENRKARDDLWKVVNTTRDDLAKARATVARLAPNHQLWAQVLPLLNAHRIDEARALLDAAVASGMEHISKDSHQVEVKMADGIDAAYHHREEFTAQKQTQMRWFVTPNLSGLVLAPFAFAGGSILRRAYVPSDSVGFKPYPGKAAGLFLLFGAGGIPALPFAAWVLRDMSKRSKEGQISL